MQQSLTIYLSLEEFAAALVALGRNDEAIGFVRTTLGDLPKEEVKGRLIAGEHALIARGLLKLEEPPQLQSPLETILEEMLDARSLIRANKTSPNGEDVLAYFLLKERWLEQFTINRWVNRYRVPVSLNEIPDCIKDFYAPKFSPTVVGTRIALPDDFFDFSPSQRRDEGYIQQKLSLLVERTLANFLANEISKAVWRGVLFKHGDQTIPALFFIQGPKTLWKILAEPTDQPDKINLFALAISESEFSENLLLALN